MSNRIQASVAKKTVLEFQPPKIELGVPETAIQTYQSNREKQSNFQISNAIRVQTGLDQIEEKNIEEEVEKRTLERIKDVQENAYQEAYQLGLLDGKHEAFVQANQMIDEKLKLLQEISESITKIKIDLYNQNEKHLVELAFHMAQRLAAHEISVTPEATVEIIRQAVNMAQSEDTVSVQVSPDCLEFLETLRVETHRDFDFLKKVRFDPNPDLKGGGCVVVSNYGEVDSRIEARVQKLWEGLQETLPRLKSKVSLVS